MQILIKLYEKIEIQYIFPSTHAHPLIDFIFES